MASPQSSQPSPDDTPSRILEAASERFRRYGYNKTTMAEIARDCEMSAANLYRFFDNKQAICAEMARGCLADCEARLAGACEAGGDAAARLRAFILEALHYSHEQWSAQPHIDELVQTILASRRDILLEHRARKAAILATVLEDGNANGEFDVANPLRTAETVLTSIIFLSVPIFMPMYPLEEFERIADEITDLLLRGLRKR